MPKAVTAFTSPAGPSRSFLPEADYEKGGGVEDPRLIQVRRHLLPYLHRIQHQGRPALSRNLQGPLHWDRKGVILPAYKGNWNVGWTKSGAIVPEKIDGKYWMYFLGTAADKTDQTGLAYFD